MWRLLEGERRGWRRRFAFLRICRWRCFVKRRLPDCASAWAQGGIAAALAPDDQADSHAADTLQAGDGLCNKEAVHSIVADAPEAVRWLAKQGVAFNLQGAKAAMLFLWGAKAGIRRGASRMRTT